jgi:hypothetical protein
VDRALNVGEQSWNRSKIMLVGEGQVGKTSLGLSLMNKLTDVVPRSTCGISALSMLTIELEKQNGRLWKDFSTNRHELASAVASVIERSSSTVALPVVIPAGKAQLIIDSENQLEDLTVLANETIAPFSASSAAVSAKTNGSVAKSDISRSPTSLLEDQNTGNFPAQTMLSVPVDYRDLDAFNGRHVYNSLLVH